MDGISFFITVIAITFGILQIILFFKLLGATKDIREIKNKYLELNPKINSAFEIPTKRTTHIKKDIIPETSKFKIGEIIINKKTNKKMKIIGFDSETGKFKCFTDKTFSSETWDLDENEMESVIKAI